MRERGKLFDDAANMDKRDDDSLKYLAGHQRRENEGGQTACQLRHLSEDGKRQLVSLVLKHNKFLRSCLCGMTACVVFLVCRFRWLTCDRSKHRR